MKLFIPELGTVLILGKDWTFKVINESRNSGLAKLMGYNKTDYYYPFGIEENHELGDERWRRHPADPGSYTFPAGTTLEVDRIYIRKGNKEFSSVSFKTRVGGKVLRFFAKLEDINRIEL